MGGPPPVPEAAPAPAAAAPAPPSEYEGTLLMGDVQIGMGGVWGNNPYQAGRYTGLNTTGVDFFSNFDLYGGAPWYSTSSSRYYELQGNNLVFQTSNNFGGWGVNRSQFANSISNDLVNNGSVEFKAGDQGLWGVAVHYDAITYTGNTIDSLYSFNGAQGVLNNNLAPFGGATATAKGPVTTFTIPQLQATGAMQAFLTGTRRNIVGGEGKYIWGDWTFTGAWSYEHKYGSMEESASVNFGGSSFAIPIDSDTLRFDARAEYTNRLWQGLFQYTFSHYSDNFTFVALPFPVSGTAVPFQRQAAYSTPPSNTAQYLTAELGSNHLIPLTRVNLNVRVGLEKQDNTFSPNTADPNLAGTPGATGLLLRQFGTTATSPDIIAEVYQVKLTADSHPFTNAEVKAWYGLDARNVSLNQFKVQTGATGGYSTDSNLNGFEFVVPQNWLKNNFGGEFSYHILPESDTQLKIGYNGNATQRSNAQVGHSYTSTANATLLSQLGPQANGKLEFVYTDRSGQLSYLTPWLNLDGPPGSPIYSGAFYQAPMTGESLTARADYQPLQNLSTSLYVTFKNENYHYPATDAAAGITPAIAAANPPPFTGVGQGIKQDYALVIGPDIYYQPTSNTNLHLYYTYELLFYNNQGNGACTTLPITPDCRGTIGFFRDEYNSGTQTVGVNGEWAVNERLKLRADYTFSYGNVWFTQFNGVFVAKLTPGDSFQNVTNYPDTKSLMNNIAVSATYKLTSWIELGVQAFLMQFYNTDARNTANAIQGAGTNAINILTPGYNKPNYTEAGVFGGVTFHLGGLAPPPPPPVAAQIPPAPARTYLVFFDWDKADLTDRARQIIADAAQASTHTETTRIEVDGHADLSGTPQYNQKLSLRRAQAVGAELVKDGVPQNIIMIQAFGDTRPLVPTARGVREPQNRRVEIVLK
jgi:outer membrane protein OmpA-like peptidoglycan-associated protein